MKSCVCKVCGASFTSETKASGGRPPEFCGERCRRSYASDQERKRRAVRRAQEIATCADCGESFRLRKRGGANTKFCSVECYRRSESARKRRNRIVKSERKMPQPEYVRVPIESFPNDPPVRADGLCAVDGCVKPLPRSKQARRYAGARLDTDPFCSSRCCRAFYGCPVSGEDESEGRAAAAKESAERFRSRQPWIEHEAQEVAA